MKIEGLDREFVIIGENIHTTRIVKRDGKLVTTDPEGVESVSFTGPNGEQRYLRVPESFKRTQDYEENRIKHTKIAIHGAMGEDPRAKADGLDYLRQMEKKQAVNHADYLDLN